jgi:lipase ATG15
MWIINSIYRWHLKIKNKYERKYQLKCRKLNEKFGYFKLIDMVPVILSIGLLFFIFFTNIFFRISSWYLFDNIRKIEEKGNFQIGNWTREILSEENNFENIVCNSSIYGLNMLKIGSLALASYTSNINNTKNYIEKSFFKEGIENITQFKIINEDSNYGVALLISLEIPNEKPLSIFAIQGSIKKLDWWLDIEIFCSSSIFSFLNRISLSQLESLTSNIITWLLTIPLRFLEKLTLFEKYSESLEPFIFNEIQKINGSNNIIFVGHSLGGGLAKYFGLKYHKESISFSGPGITPLEFKLKEELKYKYFKTNLIDVIPDYDIIPRIETTAGIRYRVLCNKGFFECHGIERTVCQMGATCRREDLSGDLCMSLFGEEYFNIRKLAGIKKEIPEEYKKKNN